MRRNFEEDVKILRATQAYTRNHTQPELVKADWDKGLDFKIIEGPYFSNRDVVALRQDGWKSVVVLSRNHTMNLLVINL